MSNSKAILLSLFLIFLSACSERTIEFENLVERGDVYYEKFSTEPFSGRVTGQTTGKLVEGRFEGLVYVFMEDGNLLFETNYKSGLKEGLQTRFTTAGREEAEFSKENLVEFREYTDDVLTYKSFYKDDRTQEFVEYFHPNGNLKYRVQYDGGDVVGDVLDVFASNGTLRLKVPIYLTNRNSNMRGRLIADGVVEMVGDLSCGVTYEMGVSRGLVRNEDNRAPGLSFEEGLKCGVEIQREISEMRLNARGG